MGIQNLLPFLSDATEHINISSLKGSSVAIDSYCWLHKGAFAVGDKLVRKEETDVHIMYCVKFVNMLLSHNIKPILVFDGRHLPAKAETEAKRRESRTNAKKRAMELMQQGKHKEAQNYLKRCVDITHQNSALHLIKVCRAMNVDCIVAPYEADAQLAYLNKIGLADYVITEDSDLTLFGCRKILFKLKSCGSCDLVDSEKLHLAMGCNKDRFTMEKFRLMCILSGCDYVDSLPGIGLVNACKFVKKTEETDLMRALDKIPAYLNKRNLTVTEEYKINVLKARATFLHMVVFDPRRRKQVRLHELSEFGTKEEHCCNAGEIMSNDAKAMDLAVGNLDPFTMKKLDGWHPDQRERPKLPTTFSGKGLKIAKHTSIWHRDYRFSISLNGTVAPTVPKTTVKKSPKPQKRIIETIEDSDEDLPTESQNDDLILKQYMNTNKPSPKRFKEDNDDDDQSVVTAANGVDEQPPKEETTPNRNPFKKSVSCKDELLSPTRISRATNSLVKNQSPVKHIDYAKLEKLSKFQRTVIPTQGQHVLSRFFGSSDKPKSENTVQTEVNSEAVQSDMTASVVKPADPMKSPNLLESYIEPSKSLLYNFKSNDSGFSVNNEEPAQKESQSDIIKNDQEGNLNFESECLIFNRFNLALKQKLDDEPEPIDFLSSQSTYTSDKTDSSESSGLPIVLSDNENDIGNSQKGSAGRMLLNESQKPKTARKLVPRAKLRGKKSTRDNKTPSSSNSTDTQSRLSMFGFQKKTILKH